MTVQEAIQILKEHNKWRRGNEDIPGQMTNPTELGVAIDTVVNHYKNVDVNINPYSARDMAKRRKQ